MNATILLIRHGQTRSNLLGLLDTDAPGPALTTLGRAQAAAIPDALVERPVSSITVSTLMRTRQTAAPLATARGLDLREEAGLREIFAGDIEMRSDAAALDVYTRAAWGWSQGELDRRIPGSEDGHEFLARFDDVVERTVLRGEDLPVLVAHGGCIRVWVGARARNVPTTFAAHTPLHNTGSALLTLHQDGGWELLDWKAHPLGGRHLEGPSGPDPTGSRSEDDGADPLRAPLVDTT